METPHTHTHMGAGTCTHARLLARLLAHTSTLIHHSRPRPTGDFRHGHSIPGPLGTLGSPAASHAALAQTSRRLVEVGEMALHLGARRIPNSQGSSTHVPETQARQNLRQPTHDQVPEDFVLWLP